jgi:hypothetical protein
VEFVGVSWGLRPAAELGNARVVDTAERLAAIVCA